MSVFPFLSDENLKSVSSCFFIFKTCEPEYIALRGDHWRCLWSYAGALQETRRGGLPAIVGQQSGRDACGGLGFISQPMCVERIKDWLRELVKPAWGRSWAEILHSLLSGLFEVHRPGPQGTFILGATGTLHNWQGGQVAYVPPIFLQINRYSYRSP